MEINYEITSNETHLNDCGILTILFIDYSYFYYVPENRNEPNNQVSHIEIGFVRQLADTTVYENVCENVRQTGNKQIFCSGQFHRMDELVHVCRITMSGTQIQWTKEFIMFREALQ